MGGLLSYHRVAQLIYHVILRDTMMRCLGGGMVDTTDLKSVTARCTGSSPV